MPSIFIRLCVRSVHLGVRHLTSKTPQTMKLDSAEFHSLFSPELKTLQSLFAKYKYEIRIAGGAVRDLLMAIRPADIDFATTATPDEMHAMFTAEQVRTFNKRGEKHGTVTCRINDKENFEITTLRVDLVCDGRRAEVKFTTDWFKDANRRDLTVNSLFLGLDGTIYDYFDGIKHIKARKILFVGDATQRIQEDYLRILRYFRFYGRLSDKPDQHEPETLDAIKDNIDGLKDISGERLWVEFKKIVTGNHAAALMKTMDHCGVLRYLGLPHDANVGEFEKIWTLAKDLSPQSMTLVPALLKDEGEMYNLDSRLKLSNNERLLGLFICIYRHSDEWKIEGNAMKFFQDLLLDEGGDKNPSAKERVYELLKYLGQKDTLTSLQSWEMPKFPVNGYDVGKAGVKKGPPIKRSLDYLFELWKQSHYKMTREQLLEHALEAEESDIPEKRRKSVERLAAKRKISM